MPRASVAALDAELRVATDAARRAGALQMDRYERLERIVRKSDHDVVTEVDHLCEELILEALRRAFPDDGSLAEEATAARLASADGRPRRRRRPKAEEGARAESGADDSGRVHQAPGTPAPSTPTPPTGRTWIVDPLDGTVNYANGIPIFCVSSCLAVDASPVLGVVYDPVRDELFTATAGGGARLDGEPIEHPAKEKLSDCVVSLSLAHRYAARGRRLGKAIRVSRVLGSASLSLAYVANGRFDAFVQVRGLSLWDVAAAGLIAAEAGALVTDGSGGHWFDLARNPKEVGILAAAPAHHPQILELLR